MSVRDYDYRARCPLCGEVQRTLRLRGRRHFVHHCLGPRANLLSDPSVCDASGRLVEDEEMVQPPRSRKTRSDAGRAR